MVLVDGVGSVGGTLGGTMISGMSTFPRERGKMSFQYFSPDRVCHAAAVARSITLLVLIGDASYCISRR